MIRKKWVFAAFIFFIALTSIPFILEFYYPDSGFIPKGDALRQNGPLLWAHIATDFFIGIAYVSITLSLLYIVKKAGKSIPFSWVFVMFGLFIIACGFTHFMGVFVVWKPWYWIEAAIQYFTVVVSLGTAIAIVPLTPKIFKMIDTVNASERRKRVIIRQNSELREHKRQLERKLQLAKKVQKLKKQAIELERVNKLKNLFLTMTSHELKTPITPIILQAEHLLSGKAGKLTKTQRAAISLILRNTDHLHRQISDVLDSAKLDAKQLKFFKEKTKLASLLKELRDDMNKVADAKKISITLKISTVPILIVDKMRIKQVLFNLVQNSLKFTPAGGNITIMAKKMNNDVIVSVHDTGIGITKDKLDKIFNRFVQISPSYKIRERGTGLGLFICAGIIKQHNGKIWAESKGKDMGTTIHFTLPLRNKKYK